MVSRAYELGICVCDVRKKLSASDVSNIGAHREVRFFSARIREARDISCGAGHLQLLFGFMYFSHAFLRMEAQVRHLRLS